MEAKIRKDNTFSPLAGPECQLNEEIGKQGPVVVVIDAWASRSEYMYQPGKMRIAFAHVDPAQVESFKHLVESILWNEMASNHELQFFNT